MTNELVASYYYDHHTTRPDSVFEVFACYDTWEDYDKNNVSFYDIYDKTGRCVNEGYPVYSFPTWEFVKTHYRTGVFI
jgi:phage terminase large subunit